MKTTRHQMHQMSQNQAQKDITFNLSINHIDMFLNNSAENFITKLPSNPSNSLFIISKNPEPALSNQANKIVYFNGEWNFISPTEGFIIPVLQEKCMYFYKQGEWRKFS